jgi:hypothetical protein
MLYSLRYRLPLLALLALVLAPATAGATSTATVAVHVQKGDRGMLTLSPKAKRMLAKQRVRIAARKPGTHSKSSYALPAKSGRWNFSTGRGTVSLKGGLQLRSGRRTVNLGSVTFSRPAKGISQVTATLKGHKVKLFTVSGRARVKQSGLYETVTGLSARLAKPSVKLIDKLLHRSSLRSGELLGSFAVTVSRSSTTGTPPKGTTPPSGVTVTFGNPINTLLGGQNPIVAIVPGLGTTIPGVNGTQITLPLAGGSATAGFDDGTLTGTLPLSGGVTLDKGAISASLTDPDLTLGTGTEGSSLSFSVDGGPEVKAFSVDTSQIENSTTSNGSLDLKDLLATVSTEGAASLNTALGTDAFTTGQPIGGLTVIVPAKAS